MNTNHPGWRPTRLVAAFVALVVGATTLAAQAQPESTVWPGLKAQYFGEREIHPGTGVVSLTAPYRAEDAAIVPISIHDELPPGSERRIAKLWLFIDNNPVPMSAVFEFGPEVPNASIATRVRVNSYTHMRAIAETLDGQLYMATEYVKASGGCSAPVSGDPLAAAANLGEIRLRTLAGDQGSGRRIQMLVRHPNNTGLQMNQLTRLVVPPHYINAIDVRQGGQSVFHAEMTFSLSQNPSLRFSYLPAQPGQLSVRVHDTEDNVFTEILEPAGGEK